MSSWLARYVDRAITLHHSAVAKVSASHRRSIILTGDVLLKKSGRFFGMYTKIKMSFFNTV